MAGKKITIIVLKTVSFLMLIFATYIATVQMSELEKEIRDKEQYLETFKYGAEINLLVGLFAAEIDVERRLDLLDVYIEERITGDKERRINMLNQALNKTVYLIDIFDLLFDGNSTVTMLPEKLDDETVINDRINMLEQKLKKSAENAISRVKKSGEEMLKHRKEKADLENKYDCYEIWFKWSQILGLILLGTTEIFEKWLSP